MSSDLCTRLPARTDEAEPVRRPWEKVVNASRKSWVAACWARGVRFRLDS